MKPENMTRNRYTAAYRLVRVMHSGSHRITAADKVEADRLLDGLEERDADPVIAAVKSYNTNWLWRETNRYGQVRHQYHVRNFYRDAEAYGGLTDRDARARFEQQRWEDMEWEHRSERAAEQAAEDYCENRSTEDYQDYLDRQYDLQMDAQYDDELVNECGDLDREEYELSASEWRYQAYLNQIDREAEAYLDFQEGDAEVQEYVDEHDDVPPDHPLRGGTGFKTNGDPMDDDIPF